MANKNKDVKLLKNSTYFDKKFYLKNYPIPKKYRFNPAKHFLNFGWKEGYNPSEKFHNDEYFYLNPDVKKSGINPLLHYEKYGRHENRKILDEQLEIIKNSAYFDEEFYKKKFLRNEYMDPALHYLTIGWKKHFDPSRYFSTNLYLLYNPDVKKANMCPLLHFEIYGMYEQPSRRISGVYNLDFNINPSVFDNPFVNVEAVNNIKFKKNINIGKHFESVDIIICVHNALNDIKTCLNSVIRNTSKPYNIILVDDNSNSDTHDFLKKFADENTNVTLLKNDTNNHGYGFSANIGLRFSTADYIILLNSDTVVTKNWVDKLINCAKSEKNIGIVGPLSNTASWQSVPKISGEDGDWCKNDLPKEISIDTFADLIEKNSKCLYPKVPLLNGFCMLIKRFVIDKIGYIDEENFGVGFGEEDDFNCRARKAGIDLAICDNLYIFHSQSKSYTDEVRLKLCEKSGKKLLEKHGEEYISKACEFMRNNLVLCSIRKKAQMYIDSYIITQKGKFKFNKKKVAFLLPICSPNGGGNVVINEAKCMQKMGIDVTLINLKSNRKTFNKFFSDLKMNVLFVKTYDEILDIAEDYDAICCTDNRTVKYCDFVSLNSDVKPKLAYYIQDYEPYFYNKNSKEYKEAKLSYTRYKNCINFTKTNWNKNEVEEQTKAYSTCIGCSFDANSFYVKNDSQNKSKLVISAMIRPDSPRRSPKMTMKVLQTLKLKFEDLLDIRIFGLNPEKSVLDGEFFNKIDYNFDFTNYGILGSQDVSELLSQTDVFLDLSKFQAMGLTAMEAMASGCAVVAPNNCGTEDFAVNEYNALLIDTNDFYQNIEACTKLINDKNLREKLSRNAIDTIYNFSSEKAAYNILETIFN